MNRFLIASLAGAAALALSNQSAMAKPAMLQSTLSGAEETAGGAPDGSGSFTGSLDAGSGEVASQDPAFDAWLVSALAEPGTEGDAALP